jgi:nucleotide-binding universal stress UspA family protein
MKTILVLAGGSETDKAVFDTALAAARPLIAHLDFLHIRIGPGEAARFTPHVDFAVGAGLRDALEQLQAEAKARSTAVARRFREFCETEAIEIADAPTSLRRVSASLREERDDAVDRMMFCARHNDLVVIGRSSRANGLPPALIELLLVGCGRPLLVAPPRMRRNLIGTALVFWKESAASARALGAALPVLSRCKRIVVVGVEETEGGAQDGIRDLARQLAWHGISAECKWMPAEGRSAAEQLESAATEYEAGLLVMGGYGHSRAREMVLGGCTQHFLDHAEWPVLMMH